MKVLCTITLFFCSFFCWSQETNKDELLNNKKKFNIQKQNPLMILDDVELLDSAQLAAIDPNDIESMVVLNQAQGVEAYGSKGAKGVVLITSKIKNRIKVNPTIPTNLARATPLYILDDVEMKDSKPLSQIDPHEIHSIEVIKETQALDLYGDKGKNGVILITTKKAYKNKF